MHIARLYEGVVVTHSFVDDNGQIFDCVPVEQQPSVRRAGSRKVAQAPDVPVSPGGRTQVSSERPSRRRRDLTEKTLTVTQCRARRGRSQCAGSLSRSWHASSRSKSFFARAP